MSLSRALLIIARIDERLTISLLQVRFALLASNSSSLGFFHGLAKSRKLEELRRPKSLKLLSTWFSACVCNFPLPRTSVFVAVRSEVHNFSLRPIDRRSDSAVHPFQHALLFFRTTAPARTGETRSLFSL